MDQFYMLKVHLYYVIFIYTHYSGFVNGEIEYNTINDDGSYSFRHTNDDIGGYYHSASGTPDNTVRGRYGSRNPATGQVEEVVYTAGPRGFRANGPKIHRKMNLAQYPPRPIGSPDDPLADPYDDPSYSFSFRTNEQSRSENNDASGRVNGLYSYIDDVGERHSVRYAAGAGTGFEVLNAVPDNPVNVGYAAPLFKAHPKTRGKMSVQRGPNGSYKLIAAGPDHRRAETRGSDGLVRGTYSYLDDKGIQRTVEYIAGAGIGYRIVKNRMGTGTHINPTISEYKLTDPDFTLTNEYGSGVAGGLSTQSSSSGHRIDDGDVSGYGSVSTNARGGSNIPDHKNRGGGSDFKKRPVVEHKKPGIIDIRDNEESYGNEYGFTKHDDSSDRTGTAAGSRGNTRYHGDRGDTNTNYESDERQHTSKMSPRPNSPHTKNVQTTTTTDHRTRTQYSNRNRNREPDRSPVLSSSANRGDDDGNGNGNGYNYEPPSSNNYNLNDDDVGSLLPPLITANRRILEIDRERDWVQRNRDSTVIKNVGKWYIGLPPGQSVRAHVQNIDLIPLGGRRVPSPSEALRQDEIAEMVASMESGLQPYDS